MLLWMPSQLVHHRCFSLPPTQDPVAERVLDTFMEAQRHSAQGRVGYVSARQLACTCVDHRVAQGGARRGHLHGPAPNVSTGWRRHPEQAGLCHCGWRGDVASGSVSHTVVNTLPATPTLLVLTHHWCGPPSDWSHSMPSRTECGLISTATCTMPLSVARGSH